MKIVPKNWRFLFCRDLKMFEKITNIRSSSSETGSQGPRWLPWSFPAKWRASAKDYILWIFLWTPLFIPHPMITVCCHQSGGPFIFLLEETANHCNKQLNRDKFDCFHCPSSSFHWVFFEFAKFSDSIKRAVAVLWTARLSFPFVGQIQD